MKFSSFCIAIFATVSLIHISCTRAKSDNSQVVISVAEFSKATLSTCTTCLKFLAVNVSGPGIPSTIYAKIEHADFQKEGEQINGEIILDIPSGDNRLIELVAAYSDTTQTISVSYGSQVTSISGTSSVVTIPLDSLGAFRGGAIVGRYLTGTNSGPTGEVNIALRPKEGMPRFTLLKTSIINGWFNFFASENFEMSYILNDGTEILPDVSLNENFKPTDLTTNTQVARATRPTTFYQYDNSTWELQSGEHSDVVFGFFFANGISDANKKVCKHNTAATLTKLSSDSAGTTLLNYDPITGSGDVNVYGGTTSCNLDNQKFTQNQISLTFDQFNGEGNNTAQSIHGAFSLKLDGSSMRKFSRNGNSFQFPTLPGLFGTGGELYNGIKLFTATAEPASRDYLRCETTELTGMGFSEVNLSGTTTAITATSIYVATSSGISGYLILCPTKDGAMNGMGGHYIGDVDPYAFLTFNHGAVFDFGNNLPHASLTQTITLRNSGGEPADISYVSSLSTPFSFSGGSYPGSGGTCPAYPGGILAPNQSCIMAVKITPADNTLHTQPLIINYSDAHYGATTLSTSFTGQGM